MFLCLETLFSLFLSLSPQSSFFSTLYCEECQTHSKVEGILVNTYHLDCTINVLLCLPYHTSIHLTIPLCILHIYIFFNVFQSKLQTRAHNLFLFFFLACIILVPWPGIKPTHPALKRRIVTTGHPGSPIPSCLGLLFLFPVKFWSVFIEGVSFLLFKNNF